MPAPKPASRKPVKRVTSVRLQDIAPGLVIRRLLHAQGLRFSLRSRDLPGRPELVLPRRRSVIFVQECFWHGHGCALDGAAAKFNSGTWAEKIAANREQDKRDHAALHAAGWQVETVWECQVEQRGVIDQLASRLLRR
jgi:DNA mismatch endonuclease (patch repair protein)